MIIFNKVLEIYKNYSICPHCLGRMFSLLGTNTTNLDRGNAILLTLTMENHENYISIDKSNVNKAKENLKILAEKANFLPAKKVLDAEGIEYLKQGSEKKCYLCNEIFDNLEIYIEKAKDLVKSIEFKNFLVGTRPQSHIINKEDIFKSELNLLNSEALKSHFNRVIGKILSIELNKPTDFENPDIVILYNIGYESFDIKLNIKPLFVAGTYRKFIRGIPQTKWICKNCSGKGCVQCNQTGKRYEISVEELISPEFSEQSKSNDSKFHGAGREDIDVRMLGTGRPFVLELKNPKIRTLDLKKIEENINQEHQEKIKVMDLRYSNKKEVISIKLNAENTRKSYKMIVESETNVNLNVFEDKVQLLKKILINHEISQRTPHRVSHRRADLVRKKKIFNIEAKQLSPNLFEFIVETQGGTYVKELVSGDEGRTSPSFTEIFEIPLICKELDVINIDY